MEVTWIEGYREDGSGLMGLDVDHAAVAQLVEHVLGKDEVMGSSPIGSF